MLKIPRKPRLLSQTTPINAERQMTISLTRLNARKQSYSMIAGAFKMIMANESVTQEKDT